MDSQTSDFGNRAYTIGTTEADSIIAGEVHYTYLKVNKWKDSPRDLEYKFDQTSKHRTNCEADAWCILNMQELEESIQVFSIGGRQVELDETFYH